MVYLKTLVMILIVKRLKVCIEVVALHVECRPEVQQYNLALQLRELMLSAIDIGKLQLGILNLLDILSDARKGLAIGDITLQDCDIWRLWICTLYTIEHRAVVNDIHALTLKLWDILLSDIVAQSVDRCKVALMRTDKSHLRKHRLTSQVVCSTLQLSVATRLTKLILSDISQFICRSEVLVAEIGDKCRLLGALHAVVEEDITRRLQLYSIARSYDQRHRAAVIRECEAVEARCLTLGNSEVEVKCAILL